MKTSLHTEWTVDDICKGFVYNEYEGKGLFGLNGQLTIQPEYQRHYIYNDGDENNVLETPIGNIGVAICWEQIRYNTLKRMAGKVDFILGLSCWWGFSENDPEVLQNINEENVYKTIDQCVQRAHKQKFKQVEEVCITKQELEFIKK